MPVVVTLYEPGVVPPLPFLLGALVCQLDSAIPVASLGVLVKLVFSGPVILELTVAPETGPLLSLTVERMMTFSLTGMVLASL